MLLTLVELFSWTTITYTIYVIYTVITPAVSKVYRESSLKFTICKGFITKTQQNMYS